MEEKDVVITYETLYEMLRIEKNREDLQKLDTNFFNNVRVYMREKRTNFESTESQSLIFEPDDKERVRLELENTKKILKNLYDKRERKIMTISLNKAKSGVVLANTANMLPSEKLLFAAVNTTLGEFRKNILYKLACGDNPDISKLPENVITQLNCRFENGTVDHIDDEGAETGQDALKQGFDDPNNSQTDGIGDLQQSVGEDETGGMRFKQADESKELKTTRNFSESGGKLEKVVFLTSIGEVVGPDLKIYGPYDKGSIESLPEELVRVLLEKRQAERAQI